MKKKRRFKSHKITRHGLKKNFATGFFLGVLGMFIFNKMPVEVKTKSLQLIVDKFGKVKPDNRRK
jgi:hypothetical protein